MGFLFTILIIAITVYFVRRIYTRRNGVYLLADDGTQYTGYVKTTFGYKIATYCTFDGDVIPKWYKVELKDNGEVVNLSNKYGNKIRQWKAVKDAK